MTIQPFYHVDPFYNNRLLNLKIYLLEFVAYIKNRFSITALKTGYVNSLNSDLANLLITLKGISSVAHEFDQEKSIEEYALFNFAIKRYNKIYSILMKINFFNDTLIQQTCTDILEEMYSIEFTLKQKAFADAKAPESDKQLIKIASNFSSHMLSKFDGCTM